MADFDSSELVYMRAEDRALVIGPAIVRASSLILLWRVQTPFDAIKELTAPPPTTN